ncbi:hypothetical protein HYPSUDRAFT_317480 [Hypholoma sublateritium FD-334 SS-4]|uniref:Uncharacterized protein n=1 Tax=Hypholoma sublateritium (strain FD-334 SS-4) TaxID=945553 RepID=A0A0D2P615_HYPSF|nr:hypothetical protein HYPSUDRAFT_317480 [Hypholoma sublateritium FD-334 SS-4]
MAASQSESPIASSASDSDEHNHIDSLAAPQPVQLHIASHNTRSNDKSTNDYGFPPALTSPEERTNYLLQRSQQLERRFSREVKSVESPLDDTKFYLRYKYGYSSSAMLSRT